MKTLLSITLTILLPAFAYGAGESEKLTTEEVSFVLPKTQAEACAEAHQLIAGKKGLPTAEILKGSKQERYLENLVRVCSALPTYAYGTEVGVALKQGVVVRLPKKNHVFRLSPLLVRKSEIAKNAGSYKASIRNRYAKKYGPLEELPWLSYCRVETADYLESIGKKHARFSRKLLVINSAFRSVAYYEWLRKINRNTIPVGTATGTTHGTLATIDIGYGRGLMSPDERHRLETQLAEDERNGLIQVTKEWYQTCLHVMVFPKEFLIQMAKLDTKLAAR